MIILYIEDTGLPALVYPNPAILEVYSLLDIAKMSVPLGKPFKLVDASDLPDAPRESWIVDEAYLVDGIGEQLS